MLARQDYAQQQRGGKIDDSENGGGLRLVQLRPPEGPEQRYAKREGIKITARFTDRAKSGASMFDRDGLIDLREAAKRREFDAIIVESLDRLSRGQEDLAGLYKRLKHTASKSSP